MISSLAVAPRPALRPARAGTPAFPGVLARAFRAVLAPALFVTVTMALSLVSADAAQQSQSERITEVTSPGGIKAWLVRDTTLPLIAMEFAFLGGASQDGPDKAGLANFTSSLLDEGAGDLDSEAFQRALADTAVELHFDASRDDLRGSLRTLSENRAKAFDLTRLAVTKPRFDAEAVERIRAAQLAMLRRRSTDPNSIANEKWFATAFPGHPYGQPVDGSLDSLPKLTRDDVAGFAKRTLARSNLRVAVVGDIDAEELGRRLDEMFGALPAEPQLKPVADVKPQKLGTLDVVPLDVSQSVVVIGTEGFERQDPDFIPAFVLNHILGGSAFSSRLFKEVREARGLAYSVHSYQAPLEHTGLWFAGTATKNERAGESIGLIQSEFRKMLAEGPTAQELDEAKKYLTGSYALRFDTSSKVAGQLLQIQLDRLGRDYIDRRNALVEAVSLDDLKRVSGRLAGAKDALVVVVGKPAGVTSAN